MNKMYDIGTVLYVEYHSCRWDSLVEMGFVTIVVDEFDVAKMMKVR